LSRIDSMGLSVQFLGVPEIVARNWQVCMMPETERSRRSSHKSVSCYCAPQETFVGRIPFADLV
jgi:hypothetical protein